MIMKHNPDDRRDNVDHIQKNIDATIRNTQLADDLISKTSDPKTKEALEDKNVRRSHALNDMRHEIKDEAKHQTKKT
jgi:small acid-soluble spore protein (thioredoxin-like protein)